MTIENANLRPLDGSYLGRQSGYVFKFQAKSTDMSEETRDFTGTARVGVRGINCKVIVKVVRGIATSSIDN